MTSEDVLGPEGGPRKKRRKKKLSPALAKMAARSLDVQDEDLRAYIPTELDLQIAEAMMGGSMQFQEIAAQVGCDPATISRAMKCPLRCAWVSQQLHRIVAKRIGMVDLSLFLATTQGNVSAMKLYYERFGELIHRSQVLVGRMDFDPSQLSDKDLDTVLRGEMGGMVDAEFTVKEEPCTESPKTPSASESPPTDAEAP